MAEFDLDRFRDRRTNELSEGNRRRLRIVTIIRGLLAPVGVAVAILVSAQVAVLTTVGAWFP
ncbi:hypothetical protein [Bounagaea algeriensis]